MMRTFSRILYIYIYFLQTCSKLLEIRFKSNLIGLCPSQFSNDKVSVVEEFSILWLIISNHFYQCMNTFYFKIVFKLFAYKWFVKQIPFLGNIFC